MGKKGGNKDQKGKQQQDKQQDPKHKITTQEQHSYEAQNEEPEEKTQTPEEKTAQYREMQLGVLNNFLKDFQEDEKALIEYGEGGVSAEK